MSENPSGALFTVRSRDAACRARTGLLALGHGCVETPAFMPVGTNATVKAIRLEELEAMGTRLVLSNSYHLYLRPGMEVIRACGGLHAFMAWDHNILTDSGGFQVFSLAPFRKVREQGVVFQSHLDGSRHELSPEDVVDIQRVLGSDILMPLDVCTPAGIGEQEAARAMELTTRWAQRSLQRWKDGPPCGYLFGILQGNVFPALRLESARQLLELRFPGYAIGGLSVGEPFEVFQETLALTSMAIPDDHPRYLMGVGTPQYILEAVEQGIDLFDCVFPTRTARNAQGFTARGPRSLKTQDLRLDTGPLDPDCPCGVCRRYPRAYLRHLFKTHEILAAMLTTYHNLFFLRRLVERSREAIVARRFPAFKREFLALYDAGKRERQ
jgi:queuine tRNA-ribosyltransferase